MNDPATAPSLAARVEALRKRAAGDLAASPEVLAAAALTSILMNEPAEVGADLATRALLAGESAPTDYDDRPGSSSAPLFARTALSLLWAERYA